jgi:hypothetical protein
MFNFVFGERIETFSDGIGRAPFRFAHFQFLSFFGANPAPFFEKKVKETPNAKWERREARRYVLLFRGLWKVNPDDLFSYLFAPAFPQKRAEQ